MLVFFLVTVILFNNGIEKLAEFSVRRVGTSVEADTRVKVLDSGENTCFEGNTSIILLIFVLVPNCLSEMSREG